MSTFHDIVGQLDYPMLVVTVGARGERAGCLVGFHTQCGINPPRYLVCVSRRNHTHQLVQDADRCAVHFLDEAGHPIAQLFGEQTGDDTDKFRECAHHDHDGVPVLTAVRAWFVGRILERIPLGDHTGLLLEPITAHLDGELRQLAFQRVKTLDPGHPA